MRLKMQLKTLLKNLFAFALLLPALAAQAGPLVEVFKSPDCGCCSEWVKHLQTTAGSPGMESPRTAPYKVLLVEHGGRDRVYQSY